jgi:hypothetical protein
VGSCGVDRLRKITIKLSQNYSCNLGENKNNWIRQTQFYIHIITKDWMTLGVKLTITLQLVLWLRRHTSLSPAHICLRSQDISVSTVTRYGIDDCRIVRFYAAIDFNILFTTSRPSHGRTQHPSWWVLGDLSGEKSRQGVNLPHPSNIEGKSTYAELHLHLLMLLFGVLN